MSHEPLGELLKRRCMVRSYLPEPVEPRRSKALLGTPVDVHFVCVVTIGRPKPDPTEGALVSRLSERRLPLDELVCWEHG